MWYKIVEIHTNGVIKTLFHGNNGSRIFPEGWVTANEKMVRDGTSKTWYLSGFHIFKYEHEARSYLKCFNKRKELLSVIPCRARHIRKKLHSRAPVYLARYIKLCKSPLVG